ncbi:MAG: hypothetical protein CMJ18_19155 [Phycisphaeraceae bacterium]|nr:hypothetical protein [Phycisphaeraceae bacterium]
MKYGVSTLAVNHLPLEPALRKISEAGFDQIEIVAEPPHFWPGDYDPAQVRAWIEALGLSAPVGHGIFSHTSPNAAALDESVRRADVERIATCFEPLVAIGAEYVVLHPTGYAKDYTTEHRKAHVDQARRSIEELAVIGGDAGIRMAWENLPHHGADRPLHDLAELRALIDDLPDHVGLCLDTTHARICGHDPLEQLNIAADRLFCLHLHDCDGEHDCHWVPGRGLIDWGPFIDRLDELQFAGTRSIEVAADESTFGQVLWASRQVAGSWEDRAS